MCSFHRPLSHLSHSHTLAISRSRTHARILSSPLAVVVCHRFCTIPRYINCLRYADSLYSRFDSHLRRNNVIEGAPSTSKRPQVPPRDSTARRRRYTKLNAISSRNLRATCDARSLVRVTRLFRNRRAFPMLCRSVLYKYIQKRSRAHVREKPLCRAEEARRKAPSDTSENVCLFLFSSFFPLIIPSSFSFTFLDIASVWFLFDGRTFFIDEMKNQKALSLKV